MSSKMQALLLGQPSYTFVATIMLVQFFTDSKDPGLYDISGFNSKDLKICMAATFMTRTSMF
jgi:hypothetical protein